MSYHNQFYEFNQLEWFIIRKVYTIYSSVDKLHTTVGGGVERYRERKRLVKKANCNAYTVC